MTRYSSGVYSIINRNSASIDYTLDNQNYEIPRNTILTICVENIMLITPSANILVSKIANNEKSVIGNVATPI